MKTSNLIIGFGKAGKTLAGDLARHGQDVVLVEQSKKMYGGTCINIGCIPSKKLLVEGLYGLRQDDKRAVFAQAMAAKEALVGKLNNANYHKVADLEGAQVIDGKAEFVDDHTVDVETADGKVTIEADRIFINTGSEPAKIKIDGADGPRIYDSTGMLSIAERPDHLVIVGGGFISQEFACMFQAFGSEVTILEAGDTFLPRLNEDVAQAMHDILTGKGIKIVTGAAVERFENKENAVSVHSSAGVFEADAVLVAIGRRPATAALHLERAGIETTERGFVKVNEKLQAKPHIWAMGDVAGSPMFTYVSLDDYRIVRDQLFGDGHRTTANRGALPTAVFTNPQLGQVGIDERQAKEQGLDFTVKKLAVDAIPKAKVLARTEGMMKAIVDNKTDKILGVTLLCEEAHELINIFKMAIDNGVTASYVKNMIFTHPTLAEGLNDLFA